MLVHLYYTDIELCSTDKCVGYGAVYRISFALWVFFFFHFLLNSCHFCSSVEGGNFMIKLFVFLCTRFSVLL